MRTCLSAERLQLLVCPSSLRLKLSCRKPAGSKGGRPRERERFLPRLSGRCFTRAVYFIGKPTDGSGGGALGVMEEGAGEGRARLQAVPR